MLDVAGVTLAGHNAPGIAPVVEQMRDWGGKPEATVWVFGGKLPATEATFVNSTLTHALDLDDVHLPSMTHITSVIVPSAIAVGEATGASGKETLAAIVIGVEVATRLAVPERRQLKGGFLPTSVLGGFGAAAAACRLKGCSLDQTVNALGIFYAHASGNRQALFDHTLTKRIQPAIAARAGVFAAYLADAASPGRNASSKARPACSGFTAWKRARCPRRRCRRQTRLLGDRAGQLQEVRQLRRQPPGHPGRD